MVSFFARAKHCFSRRRFPVLLCAGIALLYVSILVVALRITFHTKQQPIPQVFENRFSVASTTAAFTMKGSNALDAVASTKHLVTRTSHTAVNSNLSPNKEPVQDKHDTPGARKVHIVMTEQFYYRQRSRIINPHDFKYVLPHLSCDSNPYLLIFVLSAVSRHRARNAIRETWGSVTSENSKWPQNQVLSNRVRIVFLLGRQDRSGDKMLIDEHAKFGDILQEDFIDNYANLTMKTVMGLKWVQKFCPGAKFVMKCDDDMFVNLPALLTYLKVNEQNLSNTIIGHLNGPSKVQRKGKWAVSIDMFPFGSYPPYMAGNAYVLFIGVVKRLYETSLHMSFMPIEDVFITGICARIANVNLKKHDGFTNWLGKTASVCDIVKGVKITVTKMTALRLKAMWKELGARRKSC